MKKGNKITLPTLALALSALLPVMEAKANGIPAECLIPSKVMPKVCQELPADVCLDYFKARIQAGILTSSKADQTEREANFCLAQFQTQLYAED